MKNKSTAKTPPTAPPENWVKSREERQEMSAKMKRADKSEPLAVIKMKLNHNHGECGLLYKGVEHEMPMRCAKQIERDFPEVVDTIKEMRTTKPSETK